MLKLPLFSLNTFYNFEEEIWKLHSEYQMKLQKESERQPSKFLTFQLPILKFVDFPPYMREKLFGEIIFEKTSPKGRPILALEPHADDLILSLGGTLFSWNRPIHIVTLFNRSKNLHPDIAKITNLSTESITNLRFLENQTAFQVLNATHTELNLFEAEWPLSPPNFSLVPDLVERIHEILNLFEEPEIIGPFGISHHPDHLLTRQVAESLGCQTYWEDVDFYINYSRSIEDVEFAKLIWKEPSEIEYLGIDNHLLKKFSTLNLYQSQYFPPKKMCGPLCFNWFMAQKGLRKKKLSNGIGFAERIFRYRL